MSVREKSPPNGMGATELGGIIVIINKLCHEADLQGTAAHQVRPAEDGRRKHVGG